MADYTYGGGDRVVLDPVDRSRNAPSVLAGYPLDVRPLSGWPGLGSGSGQVRYDTAVMRDVVARLAGLAAALRRVPPVLAGTAGLSVGPDVWVQAGNLRAGSQQVTEAVFAYTNLAAGNLDAACAAITASADAFDRAEAANAHTAAGVQARIGGGSAAGGN